MTFREEGFNIFVPTLNKSQVKNIRRWCEGMRSGAYDITPHEVVKDNDGKYDPLGIAWIYVPGLVIRSDNAALTCTSARAYLGLQNGWGSDRRSISQLVQVGRNMGLAGQELLSSLANVIEEMANECEVSA